MKGIVFVACLLALTHAGNTLRAYDGLEVGESCDQKPEFIVSNFTLNPSQPVAGQSLQISITGTFAKSASVGQINTGLRLNGNNWTNQQYNVDQAFSQWQTQTFSYNINIPQSGSYLLQVYVNRKGNQDYIACWQTSFSC